MKIISFFAFLAVLAIPGNFSYAQAETASSTASSTAIDLQQASSTEEELETMTATEDEITEIAEDTTLAPGSYTYGTLIVKSGATLTLQGDPGSEAVFKGVRIEADSIIVENGARISADRQGYDAQTPGPGSPNEADLRSGASHGGRGSGPAPAARYDSARSPRELGSASYFFRGGGAIELVVQNEFQLDGSISASAGPTGSGGSILIDSGQLTGDGKLEAEGGSFAATSVFIGAGGGGRIAVHTSESAFTGTASVRGGNNPTSGGQPVTYAESGTVGFFDKEDQSLVTGHAWRFEAIDAPHTYGIIFGTDSEIKTDPDQVLQFGSLELSGTTKFEIDSGHNTSITDLIIKDQARLIVGAGTPLQATNINLHDQARLSAAQLSRLEIESEKITIGTDAAIEADSAGFDIAGPGSPNEGDYGTGASYGGRGTGPNAKPSYGSAEQPVDLGSGAYLFRGGGALSLKVSGKLQNDGRISADGGGSSSGGSVLIETKELSGTGIISAAGGAFTTAGVLVGSGGGGRVAIYYETSDWTGTTTANGGNNPTSGGQPVTYAEAGSVVFEQKTLCTENCNSSVLFLPGIMGSRLYEESSACAIGSGEQERWFSRSECDQLRLKMDENGTSINDIYTKPDQSAVVDEAYIFNLYKTFFSELEEWKDEGVITEYAAVAYDWRLRLDEILKSKLDETTNEIRYDNAATYQEGYLYKTLSKLVESSASGKVTIVAHSNGGLVAKQLLKTMQNNNDPLTNKIDNLILVGVPQTGTPDALVGILHGTEVGPGGLIVSQKTARELMNTMPFAYHLLPTASYFDGNGASVSTPVITFEPGEITTPMATTFGSSISNSNSMYTFLGEGSGRAKPLVADLATSEVGRDGLIVYAKEAGELQAEWNPPVEMHVYQIAGTGLETPSAIAYFTDRKCVRRDALQLFRCVEHAPKLGYRVNVTIDGDQTVVAPSALAMLESDEIERVWLNFESYNRDVAVNRKHKDILEVDDVINFVRDSLEAEIHNYDYLTNEEPDLENNEAERLIFQLHSPLDMLVRDSNGNEISSSTQTIEGGTYLRFGELQYISVPNNNTHKTLQLNGLASGSFTLDSEIYKNNALSQRLTYSGIPSGTSTKVKMQFTDNDSIEKAVLVVDYNNDGAPDVSYDSNGEVAEKVTYKTLITTIEKLNLKPLQKTALLTAAKLAEKYHGISLTKPTYKSLEKLALLALKQLVLLYQHQNRISVQEKDMLLKMILKLEMK